MNIKIIKTKLERYVIKNFKRILTNQIMTTSLILRKKKNRTISKWANK